MELAWVRGGGALLLAILLGASGGCHGPPRAAWNFAPPNAPASPIVSASYSPAGCLPSDDGLPNELAMSVLPLYRIEPPDVLRIDLLHVVPRPPYPLRSLDSLVIRVAGTLPRSPIEGVYTIEPGGTIDLGLPYGRVQIDGLSIDQARVALEKHLQAHLTEPQVAVALHNLVARQQIAGPRLVGLDGMVTLGSYGKVSVVGMTVTEAKLAIESHLSQFLERPELSVEVCASNSKVYYVITQGAGLGDGVWRFPTTGNETVLDAIAQIKGVPPRSSTNIWIARPNLDGSVQTLPVCWKDITQQGRWQSNYQIFPGDRVYVAHKRLWPTCPLFLSRLD